MVGEHARRFGQVLDRVAGMDDVETAGLESYIFDAGPYELATVECPAGLRNAFVGFHGDDGRIWRGLKKCLGEAAAIGAHIEQRDLTFEVRVALQKREGGLCAEALAIANIAPIRTA